MLATLCRVLVVAQLLPAAELQKQPENKTSETLVTFTSFSVKCKSVKAFFLNNNILMIACVHGGSLSYITHAVKYD